METEATTPPKPDTFGGRLLIAVQAANGPISHKGAAEWLTKEKGIQISGPQISKYVKHDQKPRMDQCCAYALALDVTVEWLYTGRPPMRPMPPLSQQEEELIRLLRAVPVPRLETAMSEITGYLRVQGSDRPKTASSPPRALAASARSRNKKRRR